MPPRRRGAPAFAAAGLPEPVRTEDAREEVDERLEVGVLLPGPGELEAVEDPQVDLVLGLLATLSRGSFLALGIVTLILIVGTALDLTPTILELAGIKAPASVQGDSFFGVLTGERDEQRSFVVSSWPLYLAQGEIVTAIDSKARRIADYMPVTVTTPERSLILGGPDDEPELYDLTRDPGERNNVWREYGPEGGLLAQQALSFLQGVNTPEKYLAPRREALDKWRVVRESA